MAAGDLAGDDGNASRWQLYHLAVQHACRLDSALAHTGGTGTGSLVEILVSDQLARDGIVEGTTGNDLIDAAYAGDPDGDMVDNNDAVSGLGVARRR